MTSAPIPASRIVLSTASVFPAGTAAAFELAARLGYGGVEVMVSTDPVSQDVSALRELSDYHQVPIRAIHAPCLLITQRVWGLDPWGKLRKAKEVAEELQARVVVVHPPFRWQREYARNFVTGISHMKNETDVVFAVENMFPWRAASRQIPAYAPTHNPLSGDYADVTLDVSHTAVAGEDAMQMARSLQDRLSHVHLGDGSGTARDEHLVPGRGSQPCADLLALLASTEYKGDVVLEVNTRRATSPEQRELDLSEALLFTRRHLSNMR